MSTQEIKNIINQYFDNELSKSEEIILFTQLSTDSEAREYFKELNLVKSVMNGTVEDYPQHLDDKILSNLKTEEKVNYTHIKINQVAKYLSFSFAVILLVLSIFFYNESVQYRNKLDLTYQQIYQQNKMIHVLFNALPQAEVNESIDNAIIVTPQM